MSFLTPLYIAGLALVALPVLLHLIRQTPRGRVLFSSLMFLQPSPPKVTKRSRIEHWLLLLLRAAAVALLAMAFSRPFFRQNDEQTVQAPGRRIAVLVDVSASLRRTGLWALAQERAAAIIKQAKPADVIALAAFDTELRPLVTFEEWEQLTPDARTVTLQERLKSLTPGWRGTDLARVMDAAAGLFLKHRPTTDASRKVESPVDFVVISDFQQGSRLSALQGFAWPEQVRVQPEFLKASNENNAGVHPITSDSNQLRVRIENSADAVTEKLKLTVDRAEQDVAVPPGQNRILRVGEMNSATGSVTLTGDSESFDNIAWFVRPTAQQLRIIHFADEPADEPQHLRFYLQRAFLSTADREVDFSVTAPGQPVLAADRPALAIVSAAQPENAIKHLQEQVAEGLTVICIGSQPELCRQAFSLAQQANAPQFEEAQLKGYALLTSVEFGHPLFSAFSDAKLADFTKLQIWKHRKVTGPAGDARVLARFDGEEPALLELKSGQGSVILSLFGWHGEDSRFVLWSKFVPMLNHLLASLKGSEPIATRLVVGDALPLGKLNSTAGVSQTVVTPSETEQSPTEATFITTEPGIYVVKTGSSSQNFAVNLDPQESRTTPLGIDELRAVGLPIRDAETVESLAEQRLLQARELESRQRIWQWLLVAGFCLLLLETWLAGRLGAKAAQQMT